MPQINSHLTTIEIMTLVRQEQRQKKCDVIATKSTEGGGGGVVGWVNKTLDFVTAVHFPFPTSSQGWYC